MVANWRLTSARRAAALGLAILALALGSPRARGQDRVTVRGAYYREHSTRVVQPMLALSKTLPYGLDVSGQFLVDAITSASIAAGASQDDLFTEFRKEVGINVGQTIGRTRVGLAYRQSREPDYISYTAGLSITQGVWENSGTIALNLAYGGDTIGPNLNRYLDVYFSSLSYTQALSPTLVAQLGYEATHLDGYIANPYIQVPNRGYEKPPESRLRHVISTRLAKYFPQWTTGVQMHYRLYIDKSLDDEPQPWSMFAQTVEARLYKDLTRMLELRLSYRHHSQSAAAFWCNTDPARGGFTACYTPEAIFYSADPKFGPVATHIPEVKLTWEARALSHVPIARWFKNGAFEISYGHFFQDTRYENAHLLQTGYSLPF